MNTLHQLATDPITAFQSAMADAGVLCPDVPIADGQLHRFRVKGDKRGSLNGWYVLYNDELPSGVFGSWKTGTSETWNMKSKDSMTADERRAWQKQMENAKTKRKQEQRKIQAKAQQKAIGVWKVATIDPKQHPYIKRKQIIPCGIKQHGLTLLIPLYDTEGKLSSLQFIDGDGNKRFLSGGKVTGCYCAIGEIKERLYICEGYATGATIHEATEQAVAVAFNAGNLEPVAKALKEKNSTLELIIAADNDQFTEGNPGVTKAKEAALAIKGKIAIPKFNSISNKSSDFNDLYLFEGTEVVRKQLEKAAPVQVALSNISDKKSEMTL